MNVPEQLYINVTRQHMNGIIQQQYDKGYILIQTADITSNKVLLTFEKCIAPEPKKAAEALKAIKLNSSDDIPDHILEEVFKK